MSETLFVLKQIEREDGTVAFEKTNVIIPDKVVPSEHLLRDYRASKLMLRDLTSHEDGPPIVDRPDVVYHDLADSRDAPFAEGRFGAPWRGTGLHYRFWFIFGATVPIEVRVYQTKFNRPDITRLTRTYPGSGSGCELC
jgi:hypothetical protein